MALVLAVVVGYKLDTVPRGFDGDEAAIGYYAYSLSHFGMDEYGNKLPLYFKSIGDYKFPGYSYLATIPIAVFGLSVASTRLLSAISGIGIVLIVMAWLNRDLMLIDRSKRFWLIPLLVLSSPWFLVFSKTAREANLGLFFLISGIYILYDREQSMKKNFLATIVLAMSGMTYPAYRLVGFLVLVLLAVLNYVEEKFKFTKQQLFVILLGLALLGLSLDPRSRVRAGGLIVSFENNEVQNTLQSQIWEMGMVSQGSQAGIVLSRVFDNKYVHLGLNLLGRYFQNFDPNYLFLKGNPNLPWYNVIGSGVLGFVFLPLIVFGLYGVIKHNKSRGFWIFILGWILISALPSTLTVETPNQIRGLSAWPAYLMLAVYGLYQIRSRWLLLVVSFLIFTNCVYGLKQFYIHKEFHMPWYSDQGIREVVSFVKENQMYYKKIAISNDPYIFFLFWGVGDKNLSQELIKTNSSVWNSVDSIGKIAFNMPVNCPKVGAIGVLYICRGAEIPQNSIVKKAIYFNDGVPAYSAIEFYPLSKMRSPNHDLPSRFTYMVETDQRNDGVILDSENRLW